MYKKLNNKLIKSIFIIKILVFNNILSIDLTYIKNMIKNIKKENINLYNEIDKKIEIINSDNENEKSNIYEKIYSYQIANGNLDFLNYDKKEHIVRVILNKIKNNFKFDENEINFINNYIGNWYERDFN